MNGWTQPRAYIATMTGAQTAEMHRTAQAKAWAAYLAYLAQLGVKPPEAGG